MGMGGSVAHGCNIGHGVTAALRGIVQAMLITRHMAFVGFGMTDVKRATARALLIGYHAKWSSTARIWSRGSGPNRTVQALSSSCRKLVVKPAACSISSAVSASM